MAKKFEVQFPLVNGLLVSTPKQFDDYEILHGAALAVWNHRAVTPMDKVDFQIFAPHQWARIVAKDKK